MNKTRTLIMGITVLLLIVAILFVARFVMNTVFSATEALKQMGEAPIEVIQQEERWVAPTAGPRSAFELEQGIENTAADGNFDVEREPDPDNNEDLMSVPVEESVDELADMTGVSVEDGTVEG